MSITAMELSVVNYRSFDECVLALSPHVTVLVGRNAVGKTNLVEGLQLLTAGSSFRKPSPSELLREGASTGRARLSLAGDGRALEMGLELADGKRAFTRNGKRTTAAGVRGVLPSVLFCPDDLDMVKRSASVRRAALDSFGVQLNAQYAKLLSAYDARSSSETACCAIAPHRSCLRPGTNPWRRPGLSFSCIGAPCSRAFECILLTSIASLPRMRSQMWPTSPR